MIKIAALLLYLSAQSFLWAQKPVELPAEKTPPQSAEESAKLSAEAQGYTFNPIAVKRDPFDPPLFSDNSKVSELQLFDLNEMNLVAVLTGMGRPQAMLVLPNGKTHIVQAGDQIGRHKGRVSRITENEIVVKEVFKDYQGRSKTSLTNLVLAQ